MKKVLILLTFLVAVVLLSSGCAGRLHLVSDVTAFHDLPRQFSGETFVIYPADRSKTNSQEFFAYAGMVSDQLEKKGLRRMKPEPNLTPDFAIVVAYGIDNGRPLTFSYPVIGQTGGGYTFHQGSVYGSTGGSARYSGTSYSPAQFGVVGTGVGTETIYKRLLFIDILDGPALKQGKEVKRFEGRLRSEGASGHLPAVMPKMIESLFKDFPGETGKARRVVTSL